MNAKHIEGGVELSVPVSKSRIMWLIPSTCYTQNLVCSDSSQNIPLVNAWGSRNVDGYLEIKGISFYMFSIHMCTVTTLTIVKLSMPSRHFWDSRGWKSGLSIVIWDCGQWKSRPCLLAVDNFLTTLHFSVHTCTVADTHLVYQCLYWNTLINYPYILRRIGANIGKCYC